MDKIKYISLYLHFNVSVQVKQISPFNATLRFRSVKKKLWNK